MSACSRVGPAELSAANNGNLLTAQTLLIQNNRLDCLSDQRLVPN
jgi:hypothetical protein